MSPLIFAAITSLDGYVADVDGNFDWAMPDEEVHAFVNDLERQVGTYLYGRRMYETMVYWETAPTSGDDPDVVLDYARLWKMADKVVYSTTLAGAASARTRVERAFDPDAVRRMKELADRPLSIGGPHLAAAAMRAGLVDEYHLFLNPVVVGGGNRALPDGVTLSLELVDQHRFANGVVHVHYRSRT
jgi:dihydrofolate reductase